MNNEITLKPCPCCPDGVGAVHEIILSKTMLTHGWNALNVGCGLSMLACRSTIAPSSAPPTFGIAARRTGMILKCVTF